MKKYLILILFSIFAFTHTVFAQTAIRIPSLEILIGGTSTGKRVEQLDMPSGLFTGTSSGKRVTLSSGNYISQIVSNGTTTIGCLDVVIVGDGTSTMSYDANTKKGTLTVTVTASAKPDIYEGITVVGTNSSRIVFNSVYFSLSQDAGTSTIALDPRSILYGTNSTFTVPAGIQQIYVTMVAAGGGGGGGGGSANWRGGGGGSCGDGKISLPLTVTPGQNIIATIGVGGAGGAGSRIAQGGSGNTGGNTTFGPLTVAGGNGGAGGNNSTPGSGAAASGGWNGAGLASPYEVGGAGGDSFIGFYRPTGTSTVNGYGGGGQGGLGDGSTSENGQNGANGCIIVSY